MSEKEPIYCAHKNKPTFGIGTYKYIDENGKEDFGYGFWSPQNPHDFFPDHELCTPEEIERHKKACEEWDKKQVKENE